jgi:hypothetical protein
VLRRFPAAGTPGDGDGLAVATGVIAGNKPAALPAPMSELEAPFRFGSGPSGTVMAVGAPPELPEDLLPGDPGAVIVTDSCAAGGVIVAVVTMLAVAVSVTEPTEVALAATGIWASRVTALVSDTAPTAQVALLFPAAQPLVNVGFWLVGVATRATDTPAAEPFSVETVTMNAADCPRWMLDCDRWTLTLTHSSGWAAVVLELGLGLGLELASALELALALVLA